jgi:hypothetical protein
MALRATGVVSLALLLGAARPAQAELYCVIVAGLGGEPQYQEQFDASAAALAQAVSRGASAPGQVLRVSGSDATKAALEKLFRGLQKRIQPGDALAVFSIGHGSYDGEHYKFNVPGPDPTEEDWARWLKPIRAKSQLLVHATSASGALVEALQAPGRIVVTATRTGGERNATVFPRYFSAALADSAADLDKNGWVSAREAFDHAERGVAGHYAREVRIATEHPRIAGDAAAAFLIARVGAERAPAQATAAPEALARRTDLRARIDALRARKTELAEDAYFRSLEDLFVQLAELEDELERKQGAPEQAP